MESDSPTMEQLHNMITQLNEQLRQQQQALQTQQSVHSGIGTPTVKKNKPPTYDGKAPVDSWVSHMNNYLCGTPANNTLSIAVSYLTDQAHKWYLAYTQHAQPPLTNWETLRTALIDRFSSRNKVKLARDKLSVWKQVKDIQTYNNDFYSIITDIPGITSDELIDRYSRGLKPYIWQELCTRDYTNLNNLMRDAELVESAFKNTKKAAPPVSRQPFWTPAAARPQLTPKDIGAVRLKKLTEEERKLCVAEGRCFRCREKGHMSNKCPKNGKRN